MLRSRIIPCLLVHNKGLIKTVNFKNPKYVGDPINAVKIFNEKEVDEIIVIDIDASVENRGPDYKLIENLANECRMPLCYGGGISSLHDAINIIGLGVEKLAISSAAINNSQLLEQIGKTIGLQSVAVVIDVKRNWKKGYDVYQLNGKVKAGVNFEKYLEELNRIKVGEIIINSIDNDGTMKGYDLELAQKVRALIDIPLTILGGASSYENIKQVVDTFGIIGAAAGSLFVFKGKYRAVLINYLSLKERENLMKDCY